MTRQHTDSRDLPAVTCVHTWCAATELSCCTAACCRAVARPRFQSSQSIVLTCWFTNQPTMHQPTNQPTNATNQPTNNASTNQQCNRPTNNATNQPTMQPATMLCWAQRADTYIKDAGGWVGGWVEGGWGKSGGECGDCLRDDLLFLNLYILYTM